MTPRFPRRRRDQPDEGDVPGDDEHPSLDDDEHAWWAQREIDEIWTPRGEPDPDGTPERDVLAEHFGDDWRTSFGFDPPAAPPPVGETGPVATTDPYAVLEIDATVSWEDHPDRLVGRSEAEISAGEDRIRAINAAYAELKVRRGK